MKWDILILSNVALWQEIANESMGISESRTHYIFFFFFEKEEPIRFDVLIRREKIWETWQAKFLIPTFFFFPSTINFENCNNVGYLDLM